MKKNDGYPALEMIVYGKAPMLFTKYCPLEKNEPMRYLQNKDI